MKNQGHTLTNREIDDNGLVNKYFEFNNSDFDNEFQPLEKPDIEIRACQTNKQSLKEDDMKNSRSASYIGELSSGYDATVQDDYDAGNGQIGQAGKGHEEEVAQKNNWKDDKRDAVGKAASISKVLKRTAASLEKMADMLDKIAGEDEDFEELDENDIDDIEDDDIEKISASVIKEAVHPSEHDSKKDDPEANMSAQTGDEEWINIGTGTFDDKRDDAGRPA
jgi:uncharacterized protein YdbL (DUF1318 family)